MKRDRPVIALGIAGWFALAALAQPPEPLPADPSPVREADPGVKDALLREQASKHRAEVNIRKLPSRICKSLRQRYAMI
jgi:hypothetical protein